MTSFAPAALELLHEEEWPAGGLAGAGHQTSTSGGDTASTPEGGSAQKGELTPGPDATRAPETPEAWGHETMP